MSFDVEVRETAYSIRRTSRKPRDSGRAKLSVPANQPGSDANLGMASNGIPAGLAVQDAHWKTLWIELHQILSGIPYEFVPRSNRNHCVMASAIACS
jgi:hypothetical protein